MVRALTQTGDTIVEVLIAISVVSLVLVGAYITTNRNIASTQDSQERSQATKLVETQLEYLRLAGSIRNSGDCFVNGTDTAHGLQGSDPCAVDFNGNQAGANVQPSYYLSVLPPGASTPTGCADASTTAYTVCVHWESLVSNATPDNVTMYYQP